MKQIKNNKNSKKGWGEEGICSKTAECRNKNIYSLTLPYYERDISFKSTDASGGHLFFV